MQVICNGIDPREFRPDPGARESVRRELGISDSAPVLGLACRFHAQKDLPTFLRAASQLMNQRPDVQFVLCGAGLVWKNRALADLIRAAGVAGNCRLLGQRGDMPRLLAALDVAVSSSRGEGFPNSIAESMACGVVCVVTNVGESASLLGGTGRVVPPEDAEALCAACENLLSLSREERLQLGAAARRRIQEHFSLDVATRRYEELYAQVASGSLGRNRVCAA
jgi:glycosyltransferase involved in cell wall biosynthesis